MRGHVFLVMAILLAAVIPAPVLAHPADPYHLVVQAGPYQVEVGFSEWPLLAERSVDITLIPIGGAFDLGITDKTATLAFIGPGSDAIAEPLGRHPRFRDYWGLDLTAFPVAGDWSLVLTVAGAQGEGTATIGPFTVGPRPGPPPLPMFVVGFFPAIALIGVILLGWRRVQPTRTPNASGWA